MYASCTQWSLLGKNNWEFCLKHANMEQQWRDVQQAIALIWLGFFFLSSIKGRLCKGDGWIQGVDENSARQVPTADKRIASLRWNVWEHSQLVDGGKSQPRGRSHSQRRRQEKAEPGERRWAQGWKERLRGVRIVDNSPWLWWSEDIHVSLLQSVEDSLGLPQRMVETTWILKSDNFAPLLASCVSSRSLT